MTSRHWENEKLGGPVARPFWIEDDELLLYDPLRVVKIASLSRENFLRYQKDKLIPSDYKIEDWINS